MHEMVTYLVYSSVSLFILCDLSSSPKVAMPIATPDTVANATGSIRPAIAVNQTARATAR